MTDDVIAGIEQAVRQSPGNIDLRLHLVSLLMAGGRSDEALAHCEEALRLDPGHVVAAELSHQCSEVLDRPDPEPHPMDRIPIADDAAHDFGRYQPVDFDQLTEAGSSPRMSMHDVAGLEDVKRQIDRVFLGPLRNPELQQAFGASVGGGLLLWGPPGCGKTFIARALAGELGVSFIHVGIADVLDMWVGRSERNLASVFRSARASGACVLFLDELDALGHRRSRLHSDALRTTVNQLLTELDGAGARNSRVLVIAATNQPWMIDPALRRPGRFDRSILVLPPDGEARFAILSRELAGKPLEDGIDLNDVTSRTAGYSGADLVHVVESATALALEASIDTGEIVPISPSHIDEVLSDVGPSTAEWISLANDAARFSEDTAMYEPFLRWVQDRR